MSAINPVLIGERAVIRARPFCAGCGTYFACRGEHRLDCTASRRQRVSLAGCGSLTARAAAIHDARRHIVDERIAQITHPERTPEPTSKLERARAAREDNT